MKILYVVPNPPSLVRVRPYNLIRGLSSRGHQITVATVWSNREERHDIIRLETHGFRVIAARLAMSQIFVNLLAGAARGLPLQAVYSQAPALTRALADEIGAAPGGSGLPYKADPDCTQNRAGYDLIHVEHLRAAEYGLALRSTLKMRNVKLPIVWDSVDCISALFEQALMHGRGLFGPLLPRLDLARTRRYEARLPNRFDEVLVTSELDKKSLEGLQLTGSTLKTADPAYRPVTVLPNGVDLAYFKSDGRPRDPGTIIFTGRMSYHSNIRSAVYLAKEVMPLVWSVFPEARVVIAGKDPSAEISGLRRHHPNIIVTGTIPDLRPYLLSATVAVPSLLYGAGIQNKVLEAMACGTPVVASRQAVSALRAAAGEHFLLAGDAAEFARHIVSILADPALARRLGAAGRSYVEQHHDWNTVASRLEEIYREAKSRIR